MKILSITALASITLLVGSHAAAGVIDRSAEVAAYIRDIQTGTRGAVTDTAKEIIKADLGDEQLAEALYRKLTADLPTLKKTDDVDMEYQKAMVLAIGAIGAPGYGEKLKPICTGIKLSSMSRTNYCHVAVSEMDLNRKKNLLVADDKYFRAGEDPRVGRIMSMIMSDDFYFKHMAAHRMNWGKILDVRLTDAMADQLPQYIPLMVNKGEHETDSALAGYIKMLGYSGNQKYRPALEAVVNSKARMAFKKRAKSALRALDQVQKQTGGQQTNKQRGDTKNGELNDQDQDKE